MKKSLLSLIFCCNIAFATSPYEEELNYFWEDVVDKRQADKSAFLPNDMKTFLETSAEEMQEGEHLLLAFYPQDCGFDRFIDGDFVDMQEFFKTIKTLKFEIFFCLPQRNLVRFQNREEMQKFVRKIFNTDLRSGEVSLEFPTKFFIVELIK